ncbi:mitochondrial substrate carrier protein [Chloropicon primus]|uniref:Mitochondrial substrate carrier protein n=1 Tax=Chloropicon primus TaxID=1764295 RepID=A0A5B8MVG0_9CHLO|nr:mitochondrial substrate carrier protein [Chloropicon primus]UPR02704.1 mitochondrial substrate carrier protein [Chloropicon primus]|eukprot:QDZ23492.1 mitochondrial substrate carrier protein [Chloropicon primus]
MGRKRRGSGGNTANAAEVGRLDGSRRAEKDSRPQLWPAVLLKSLHRHVGGRGGSEGGGEGNERKDLRLQERKKKIAEALVAAKVRGRKARKFARHGIRAGYGRLTQVLHQVHSEMSGSGTGAESTSPASEEAPAEGSAPSGRGDPLDPSKSGDEKEGGAEQRRGATGGDAAESAGLGDPSAATTAPNLSESVPVWPDMSAISSAAYEKLREARESLVIPPFFKEFNDQMKGGMPSKRRLDIVQEFFKYTEDEAKRFFDELDRNKDGVVTLDDMRVEMKRRNLPEKYADNFIKRAKRHAKWPFGKSIVWEDFRSLNQERESAMLANFNALDVSQFGSLKKHQIKSLLQKMQFPASDDNADSMLRYLDADASGYVSYGKYRNFLILIPKEKIESKDIGMMWFESATMVPMIVPTNSSKKMLVLSTLASAMISGTSTLALHPLDTVKTMLQASSKGTIMTVFKDAAKLGRKGLYRGIIPATAGAASSQGFRVGVFEAAKLGTKMLLPSIPDLQVQTIASGMGSFIGTAVRIPCEVLKQRLQAGQYTGVVAATSAVMKKDGLGGLFRGSAATLSREIPFYVIGMVAYEQFKKAALNWSREKRGKDLEPWETIALGALSGAVAAALTTPFDVLKTRLMTSAVGAQSVTIRELATKLVKEEGPGVLFKGALPRALWIAPVGAMNFAGYELAKNALDSSSQ